MASFKEHMNTWKLYVRSNIKKEYENPETLAGRKAEMMLQDLVDSHYKFKGSHCFSGKRVFNRHLGHKNEKCPFDDLGLWP